MSNETERVLGRKRDKEREREQWSQEKVRGTYQERKDRTVNH